MRLDKAYAVKTLGELDELMADLPAADFEPLPDASLAPAAGGGLWFLWVVLPLGAVLLGRRITGTPARGER